MSDVIGWGVLGVAGINAAMVPAIRASAGAELVGIASRDERRAREVAAAERIRPYVGYESLLAETTVDAVYLPTPNAQHAPWALRAIAAGKHVLCEKPLAVTAAEAREMADAAAQADLVLAEAFMYAHHPRYHLVRRLIAEGAIGDLRSVHVTFTFDASGELGHSGFQGAPGSGAIYDVGCYAVHVARTLIGAEPEAVTAHAMSSAVHGDIDMSTSLLLEFPGGVGATAQLGMWNGDRDTVTVIGTRGWIEIPRAFLCSAADDADVVLGAGESSRVIAVPPADHYALQTACFDAAVRGEGELLFPIDDAIRQAVVLEAASRSWRERIRVPISGS